MGKILQNQKYPDLALWYSPLSRFPKLDNVYIYPIGDFLDRYLGERDVSEKNDTKVKFVHILWGQ